MLTAQSSTILIVDDQPTNLKRLFNCLQECGYKIVVAKRGESAIKKLQKVLPDIILLDVMLPGIDGFETCERLKASPKTKDIPVIFMTARSESIDKIKGLKVGAVDYITKPFQQEEVLARIENQIKIRKLQKQLEEKNQQLQQEINTRRQIEERLELVIQAANDGFWDLNLDSGEIYISPRCKEMIGYSDQELPNELASWENHIFPEDRIATLKLVEDYNSGQVSRCESIQRFHHKNGSTVHILVRALHLKDADGQVNRMIGAYTDITEITNTLETLRHSRRLLAGVLNSSLDGVAAFSALRDSQGNIIDFICLLLNPAAEKITGRTESELVGKQMLLDMPEILGTGMFEQYVSVVETGKALETEHYYVHENIQAWFQVAAVKLGDGFAVTFRDLTERQQMEERNQALLDAIPDVMLRQRVDGTYLDVRTKEGSSIVSAELIGRNLRDSSVVKPEAVKQEIFEHLQAAVETGKLQIYEYELPGSDGVRIYESRCVKSGMDEAIRIVRDVTESKRSHLALRESEAQFRGIFENAAIGIGLTGADGKLLKANPTLEAFLGYSETEMCGHDFANITHPDDRAIDLTLTSEVIEGVRDSFQIEKRYIRKNGQIFWGRLTVSAVRNLAGEFQFTVAILEDITEGKKTEERLRLLESAVVNANDAVIITEAEPIYLPGPKIVYVNEAFTRMTGYSKEEVIGQTPRILQGAKTDRTQLAKIKEALRNWQSVRVELINYHKDGSQFWVELEIVPVSDETGWFTHWVSVQRDITERKQVQEALLIARQRLDYLLFSSPSIIYSCPTNELYSVTFVSENISTIFGYKPQQFVEDSSFWISRIHPDDIDRLFAELPQLFEVGYHSGKYRFLHQDGTYRWVMDAVKIVHDEAGNPIECIGSWLDITESKQTEERLRLLERAIAASGNAIAISDAQAPNNPIIYVNSGFERMTGYQKEDVIGSQYFSYLQIGATLTALEEVYSAIAQGRETQVTVRSSRIDGTLFWNELCITPVRDDRGRLTHLIGVQTDISDRKQVEEALRISEERLQLAIEGSGMGLWDWKLNTGQAYFDPHWKTILGYEVEEIENSFRSWERLLHPEDLPCAIAALNAHFEGSTPIYEIEVRMLSKSGEWKWIFSQGKVMERDVSGAPVRITGTHIDISDRKQAQERLRLLERAIAASNNGIIISDAQACNNPIIYINSGFERMTGYQKEDVIGKRCCSFEEEGTDIAPTAFEQVQCSLTQGRATQITLYSSRKNGTFFWSDFCITPVQDATGCVTHFIGVQTDISDLVLAQESLRESEERFRAMANSTAVLLWMSDTEGQSTFFNKTWLAFTGRTLEQELGLGWLHNVHPDDQQRCWETCFQAIKVRENIEVEYRLLRFDGEYRWIVDLGKPRFTPNGSFAGYIGSCLDITERKQAEIEIKTAKAALERHIQRVLLLEQITQEIRSSLQPEQIFQTAADQIGEAFRVNRCIIHTYIAQPFPRIPQVAEYREPGYPSMMDLEIPVVGNSHAELVLSQDQAVASNDVYSDPLLEGISDVMQCLGLKSVLVVRTSYQDKPNGIICLEQCDRFRVWTAEEIELLEAVAAQMGIAIAQANLLEQEKQQRRELAAQNHALEKAKLEAEAANLAKSQFLSKMSHELRTPLNAILGFSQVMARDHSLSREQLEHLGIINRSGEHLLELINDILSMSKIEAGKLTLNENRFDLYQLLDSLEKMLQLKATSKGLELIFERTSGIPQYIQTDESKLRQVLINLLGNAIKFTQTGSVTLRVRGGSRESGVGSRESRQGGQEEQGGQGGFHEQYSSPYPDSLLPILTKAPVYSLTFEVEDTGPGIAPEVLETIFDPFVQTKTGRQSMEGTGLGLPISQQFVRMLGGDIIIKSTLGRRAIFTFDIQVCLATSADEKPRSSQRQVISLEPNQPSYRILVVEDVVENRQLLVEMLEFVGFEVREATNGQEGVALWESWSPHLICMDIILPVMDGYEATQQIKQTPKGKDTIIIALTASAFEEQREAILRVGCDDFLPKPFQHEVLLEKIADHLGVRYVYEEQRSPTLDQPPAPEERLIPQALAVMPASWVTQLHQAALYADDELMNQLVEQIPLEHGSLRRALKNILNNFRLEELIDLTEPAESPEG